MERRDVPSEDEDELLDVGARRLRRRGERLPSVRAVWARRAAVVIVAAVLVVVAIRTATDPSRHRPHAASRTPAPSVSAAPTRGGGQLGPIDAVRALAEQPGPLVDYVRQDTPAGVCAPVRVGHSPIAAVLHAEDSALGKVTFVDARRTLDQNTGLCALAVRSVLPHAIITVTVSAPPAGHHMAAYDALETGIETLGGTTVEYAQTRSQRGWLVVVGATGRQRYLPGSQQLEDLAQASDLLW